MQIPPYDYVKMCTDAEKSCAEYPFAELFYIGESVMGKPIYCIKIGTGRKKLFINAAHHGLEYLTSALIMNFLFEYASAISSNAIISGICAPQLFSRTSLYAVPMVNPDGADLAIHGINFENSYHRELVKNVGILPFQNVWQANIRGVDINHNYNAMWQSIAPSPAPTKYSGEFPESEPETKAMVNLSKSLDFDMAIAFHSQGGEIYYDFNRLVAPNSYETGLKFAELSGYKLCVPNGTASFGGYKDWFIEYFGKAGFTIEIGCGKNPLPMNMLSAVYRENLPILLYALGNC